METHTEKAFEQPSPSSMVMRRIDRRVERTLANPNLTPEQMQDVFTLANLSKLALSSGNPVAIHFAEELIKLTNPLMVPEESAREQK